MELRPILASRHKLVEGNSRTMKSDRDLERHTRRTGVIGDTSLQVRAALRGDEDAWSWIVAHLTPLLEMQAAYRLGKDDLRLYDPKDVVHEAWMVAFRRMGDLQPREERFTPVLLKFLSTTLLRKINDIVRKRIRRGGDGAAARDRGVSFFEKTVDARTTSILTRAARNEAKAALEEALGRLSVEERETLVLLGIEQIPPGEVARSLGLKPSALSMRYRRALEKARRILPDEILVGLE